MRIRTYRELKRLTTFKARFDYLNLSGVVGNSTFGHDRYLNQALYHSARWRSVRDQVIIRDEGCDLAVPGFEIYDQIVIHHMNPISSEQIEDGDDIVFDLDTLITTCQRTHNAIHFGNESLLSKTPVVRRPGDTIPWR
jgi:hypothetical protein